MATKSNPVETGDPSFLYSASSPKGQISTSYGEKSAEHLSPRSKCASVAFVVGGVAGIVLVILGATNLFGPIGSTGFMGSVAGGGSLVVITAVGLLWIVIPNCKQSDSELPNTLNEVKPADQPLTSQELRQGEKSAQIRGGGFPSLLPSNAFGAASWKRFYGKEIEEPPLPKDIQTILNGPCPYFPEKQVWQTHFLVLVPSTLDGAYTWPMLHNLVPNTLRLSDPLIFEDPTTVCIRQVKEQASHWVLMLKEATPDSFNKHVIHARNKEKEEKYNYKMPNLLEATVAILGYYTMTGERLFPTTEIYCEERGRLGHVRIGCFGEDGLLISLHKGEHVASNLGVGVLRVL